MTVHDFTRKKDPTLPKPNYRLILFALGLGLSSASFAKPLYLAPDQREALFSRAEVWFQPAWIDDQGQFASTFDPSEISVDEPALRSNEVNCSFVYAPPERGLSSGLSPKFHCELPDSHTHIKVKYGERNGEVWGEVLATRLLWSLGFGADQMIFMDRTTCQGCSADPFHQKAAEPTTSVFSPTAIERKFQGTEIIKQTPVAGGRVRRSQGWGFEELARTPHREQADALILLTMFINHLDNRNANQRLVCLSGATATDCTGRVAMILQDVGSTFGGGFNPKLKELEKVNFDAWSAKPIWSDAATCTASVSKWSSQNLFSAQISEEGRLFLLKLLKGFSADPSRVEKLFSAAQIERRGGHSAQEWTTVFLRKVKEIEDVGPCPPKAPPTSAN